MHAGSCAPAPALLIHAALCLRRCRPPPPSSAPGSWGTQPSWAPSSASSYLITLLCASASLTWMAYTSRASSRCTGTRWGGRGRAHMGQGGHRSSPRVGRRSSRGSALRCQALPSTHRAACGRAATLLRAPPASPASPAFCASPVLPAPLACVRVPIHRLHHLHHLQHLQHLQHLPVRGFHPQALCTLCLCPAGRLESCRPGSPRIGRYAVPARAAAASGGGVWAAPHVGCAVQVCLVCWRRRVVAGVRAAHARGARVHCAAAQPWRGTTVRRGAPQSLSVGAPQAGGAPQLKALLPAWCPPKFAR